MGDGTDGRGVTGVTLTGIVGFVGCRFGIKSAILDGSDISPDGIEMGEPPEELGRKFVGSRYTSPSRCPR
jgi:hypothetical protein